MHETTYITAPREGVNDDVVRVVEWQVAEGMRVDVGAIVAVVETTKATIDLPADRSGFLFHLAACGAEVPVGAPLAAISQSPQRPAPPSDTSSSPATASQVTITAKARPLMQQHGLSADDFPGLSVVRTSDVEALLVRRAATTGPSAPRLFRGEPLDPNFNWDEVLARTDARQMGELLEALRRRMKARFDRHVPTGTLLADRWQLARDHGFGEGTSVYDECLILGDVNVGQQCWIGPFTVLDGQGGLTIGDYVDIGTGAHIYSHNTIERALTGHRAPLYKQPTTIGNCCFIAPHAIIGPGTVLGDHSFVAAGSYVEGVHPAYTYLAGNPARVVGKVEIRGDRARLKPSEHEPPAV
jgi:acetyltransferase-like isoleucine patch superfamily enzyme